jgi:hypothetical protein
VKIHSKRVGEVEEKHSKRVEKSWNYTRSGLRILQTTSGEDEKYTRKGVKAFQPAILKIENSWINGFRALYEH